MFHILDGSFTEVSQYILTEYGVQNHNSCISCWVRFEYDVVNFETVSMGILQSLTRSTLIRFP